MNNNFLGIRGLYKTHMDGLKPFSSKLVTYTYIGYTEHNSRGQPIVRRAAATPAFAWSLWAKQIRKCKKEIHSVMFFHF